MQSSPVSPGPNASPVTRSTILASVFGAKTPQEPFTMFVFPLMVASGLNSVIPHPEMQQIVILILWRAFLWRS